MEPCGGTRRPFVGIQRSVQREPNKYATRQKYAARPKRRAWVVQDQVMAWNEIARVVVVRGKLEPQRGALTCFTNANDFGKLLRFAVVLVSKPLGLQPHG
jgi:hypothetical protein